MLCIFFNRGKFQFKAITIPSDPAPGSVAGNAARGPAHAPPSGCASRCPVLQRKASQSPAAGAGDARRGKGVRSATSRSLAPPERSRPAASGEPRGPRVPRRQRRKRSGTRALETRPRRASRSWQAQCFSLLLSKEFAASVARTDPKKESALAFLPNLRVLPFTY